MSLIRPQAKLWILSTICSQSEKKAASQYHSSVEVNSVLCDLNTPGTSKLDWRYFEHKKIDRNELQIHKNLQKGTGTKMAEQF